MKSFTEINHPLVQHKLSVLRNKETSSATFRKTVEEMTGLLAYEVTRHLQTKEVAITTPLEETTGPMIAEDVILVSIMRAGNSMLEALLNLMPFARAGHIGIYRDKFIKNTVEYYFRLPQNIKGKRILLADPIVATGDTVIACLDRLKQYEVGQIHLLTMLISPEGLEKVQHFHPDVDVLSASKERGLNEKGYLLPGIGDAGNRLYHTLE
ncbi:uracil phosphoribosyltransferase [Acanthopleuribacter pedis]|uniref:Uracil phosphoribosyltransferase n=1 Tax=Acanthopleuribacter pedis TaxID=442870 RepID=A0A8J7QAA2_9BACT|nr:uracil phosphoribosyltransferase [Acanthopleuribacter pedis]MBO1320640.1 uracil phosphoribosyltransferase [Acanthopleuribacter pedis]